jgi:hypothetical protein
MNTTHENICNITFKKKNSLFLGFKTTIVEVKLGFFKGKKKGQMVTRNNKKVHKKEKNLSMKK